MITATTTHHFFTLITIMLTSTISSQTPSPSSPCADSVISFSPCLPYISAPPNNLSNEPSSQCCDIFNGAFDSEDADCRCYLVRQNSLLGFQLNVTKLMWLSDLCSVKNGVQANDTVNSLDSICLGSPTLPPLNAMPKKPPTDANARQQRARPRRRRPTLHHPPPSTIIKPKPANNASPRRRNTTKPSNSEQSNDLELTNSAYVWWFLFEFVKFIIDPI